MPLSARNRVNYRRNAQGTARPFLMGLNGPTIIPSDKFHLQAFTEVSGMNLERGDGSTFTMPSDTDPFTLDEITTSYGTIQTSTFTMTEYMDERQNAPYLAGVRRNLPFAIWVPQGRGRLLGDKDDFTSGTLVELAYFTTDSQDDNFNPSDGDVGSPNKISVTASFHGRNRHTIRAATFSTAGLPSMAEKAKATAFLDQVDGTHGARTRQWFILEDGGTSTKPMLHYRNPYGTWAKTAFLADDTKVTGFGIAGGSLLAFEQGGADSTTQVFSLEDLSAAPVEVDSAVWTANTVPQSVYVRSASEIFIVGGITPATAASVGMITKSTGVLEAATVLGSSAPYTGAAGTNYAAIHGRGDQIVVVGSTGGTTETPLILVSNDGGKTFSSLTIAAPVTGSGATQAVYVTGKDSFWIGTEDGSLFYTLNFGKTFTEVLIPSMRSIQAIGFVEPEGADVSSLVGYIAGQDAGATGDSTYALKMLRTIDGGSTWPNKTSYVIDEVTGAKHANTSWLEIAVADSQSVLVVGESNEDGVAAIVEFE